MYERKYVAADPRANSKRRTFAIGAEVVYTSARGYEYLARVVSHDRDYVEGTYEKERMTLGFKGAFSFYTIECIEPQEGRRIRRVRAQSMRPFVE